MQTIQAPQKSREESGGGGKTPAMAHLPPLSMTLKVIRGGGFTLLNFSELLSSPRKADGAPQRKLPGHPQRSQQEEESSLQEEPWDKAMVSSHYSSQSRDNMVTHA
jgi:hypothetical protein